jgi:chemotaxis family two-component system sensor kinase Cph1
MRCWVLVNLLSNAVKFTGNREQAVIEIACILDQPDEIVFFVRDDRAGFDIQHADKLFGVFQRLYRADEFEDISIRLANVKHSIHRHCG